MLMERGFSKPRRSFGKMLVSGSGFGAQGGRMRKYLIMMLASILLGFGSAGAARAQNVDWGAQKKQMQTQQKLEWRNMTLQQKNMKRSWKGQRVTSAQRTAANREMQRQRRDLKTRQKDALQDFKDRQRNGVAIQRTYGN
jgi:hypothetical protein